MFKVLHLFKGPASLACIKVPLIQWMGAETDRQLQRNQLSLRDDRSKFKTFGKPPILFRGIYGTSPKSMKKNRKITTRKLVGHRFMPRKPPGTLL